jgi:hypothetical protein
MGSSAVATVRQNASSSSSARSRLTHAAGRPPAPAATHDAASIAAPARGRGDQRCPRVQPGRQPLVQPRALDHLARHRHGELGGVVCFGILPASQFVVGPGRGRDDEPTYGYARSVRASGPTRAAI